MVPVLVLGMTLGLDSLRVCTVLGLQDVGARMRLVLPIAFGISDGIATGVGMVVGSSLAAAVHAATELVGAVAMCGCGIWLVCMKYRAADVKTLLWLPLPLGLDNLGAGVALRGVTAPMAAAIAIGALSAAMAALGLVAGAVAASLIPASHVRRAAGLTLMVLSALMFAGVE